MPRKSLEQRKKEKESSNRIKPLVKKLIGVEDPDELMLEIMQVLLDSETTKPSAGSYYTFVYSPKTRNIRYDEYPLVAVTELFTWGFRGINFHWGEYRQYTWEEINGKLYEVFSDEITDIRKLPYGKFQSK